MTPLLALLVSGASTAGERGYYQVGQELQAFIIKYEA